MSNRAALINKATPDYIKIQRSKSALDSFLRLEQPQTMKATSTEPSMKPRLAGLARFFIGRPSLMALALICWLWTGCSKSNLHVVSAVYGMGTNYVDVSSRVNDLLEQAPVFDARPETMQGDPDPGWHKTLVIVYEVKGHRHIFTAKEDDSVGATILLEAAKH